MPVKYCIPVIPSADLEKSIRFWVEGLGLSMDKEMRREGKLIGCMVQNENLSFWLNENSDAPTWSNGYEGIRLYWTPTDIQETWQRLKSMGYVVTEIEKREYGQTEFFVTDDDGYEHSFGVSTSELEIR